MHKKAYLFSLFSLLTLQLGASSSQLVKLDKSSYFASHKLGDIDLYHKDGQFIVKQGNQFHAVKTHNIPTPELRDIKLTSLSAALKHSKININQDSQKDFILRSHVQGNGGGKILEWIGYIIIKLPGELVIRAIVSANPAAPEDVMRSQVDYCAAVVAAAGSNVR